MYVGGLSSEWPLYPNQNSSEPATNRLEPPYGGDRVAPPCCDASFFLRGLDQVAHGSQRADAPLDKPHTPLSACRAKEALNVHRKKTCSCTRGPKVLQPDLFENRP